MRRWGVVAAPMSVLAAAAPAPAAAAYLRGHTARSRWAIPAGRFGVVVGISSRDLPPRGMLRSP